MSLFRYTANTKNEKTIFDKCHVECPQRQKLPFVLGLETFGFFCSVGLPKTFSRGNPSSLSRLSHLFQGLSGDTPSPLQGHSRCSPGPPGTPRASAGSLLERLWRSSATLRFHHFCCDLGPLSIFQFFFYIPVLFRYFDHWINPCCPEVILYHSRQNQFERFRGFLQLISRFEFDFRRRGIFLKDSNFWCVQSSITHNVAVHVPVLWPVCAHTQFHFECCGFRDS